MPIGAVIANRFELEAQAAEGGMGTVYRARDRGTGAIAAVKLLNCRDERDAERFEREARLLAEMEHPAVVRYLAHGWTDDAQPFIAMEWLEGEDLYGRLRRTGVTLRETLTVLEHVTEALVMAHRRGVVHRDIKPHNLFLPSGDVEHVKLLDFGIARFQKDHMLGNAGLTQTGVAMGTPGYMAPEQVRANPNIDGRADLFSLGCVAFECLTGQPPFVGEHLMAVLAKILLEEAPRVRELRPTVPHAVDELVARLLAKDPEGRLPSAVQLLEELRSLRDLPLLDAPSTTSLRPMSTGLTESEQRVVYVVLASAPRVRGEALVITPPAVSIVETEMGVARTLPSIVSAEASPGEPVRKHDPLRGLVAAHGGRLEQLIDGTYIATLTGMGSATDLAARAARCALALQERLGDVAIALATGRAEVTGRLPMGAVIDSAARILRKKGKAGGIRVDEVTAGLLDVRFDVRVEDNARILVAEHDFAEAARTLLGKPTPCVGRNREILSLEAIFAECASEDTSQVVLLTSPAGVGKSRIRHEFLERLRERRQKAEILMARGDPMSAGSSFGLLGQALRRAAGILSGEPLEAQRAKLASRVGRHLTHSHPHRVVEFVGELVSVPFDADNSSALRAARNDPMLMGDHMRAAWTDFLDAECAQGPVILVLEDLQWGDLASIKFVDTALRSLRERPFMVLALARPEVHALFPDLWSERGLNELRITELSRKASEKLVREVLGDTVDDKTVEAIAARAEGNAFYLEELIRAVADGKGDELPDTVLAMIQARLDALEIESRRVLRAASVFGKTFHRDGVRALLGSVVESGATTDVLGELVKRELIERRGGSTAIFGDVEFQFRHALVREAAYAMLTDADRALGHRLAGEWLEKAGIVEPLVLAEHYLRGGEQEKAAVWFLRAAEQSLEGNDLEGAFARAQRGIDCGATGENLGVLYLLQAEAQNWRGRFADGEPLAAAALEHLESTTKFWYRAVAELVTARGRLGQYGRVAAWGRRLRAATPTREVARAAVTTSARAVTELLHAGRYDLADPLFTLAEQLAAEHAKTDPVAQAWLRSIQAIRSGPAGNPGGQILLLEEAHKLFMQAGHVRSACSDLASLGELYAQLGMFELAETTLDEALASAERMGLTFVAAEAQHGRAYVFARRGRLQKALDMEREAAESFVEQGDRRMEGAARSYLAQIALLANDLALAEAEAKSAVQLLSVAPPLRAEAWAVLAIVLLRNGLSHESLSAAREAMEILSVHGGVQRGETLVRLAYGEALLATGDRAGARAAIATAHARVNQRADTIVDPVLRGQFLTNVAENARVTELLRAHLE